MAAPPWLAHRLADTIGAWSTDLVEYKGSHGATRARAWLASL